jgi:DNA polymerase
MNTLFLDTETWSEIPIKHGAYAYAEAAEVLLIPFAWNDEPVTVWDLTDGTRPHWREELQEMIDYADVVVIHNSAFDRTVLRHCGVHIPVEKIEDTMVTALLHAFPGSLDKLCGALRLPIDKAKDKDGKRLIQLFTKPRPKNQKLRRATKETHPDDWQKFIEYAARDVDAMRSVRRVLPAWNTSDAEIALWRLDQRVNDRGVAVDLELADAAGRAFARASRSLAARAARLTGGAVASLTQRDKFLAYLRSRGVDPADLTKATVASMVEQDLPADILELLEIRQQAASTTPAKYGALRDAASSDGRLRGCIQFSGAARTRRDCLAEGTPVLVKDADGRIFEVPIESVTTDHLVWDGCEWVAHEGVVYSGDKTVLEHDGVVATAEHVVYLSDTESTTLGEAKRQCLELWSGAVSPYTS